MQAGLGRELGGGAAEPDWPSDGVLVRVLKAANGDHLREVDYSVRVGVVSQVSHRARKYLNVSDGAPPATYQLASDWLKSAGGSLDLSASHVAGISSTQPRNAANQQQFAGSTRRQRVDNAFFYVLATFCRCFSWITKNKKQRCFY